MDENNSIDNINPPVGATPTSTSPTPPPPPPITPNAPPPPSGIPTSPNPNPNNQETWRTVVTILFLLIMPLVGLILTWAISRWSKTIKVIVTVIFFVYIAIFGIIVAAVLVGMNTARGKAQDTLAKSNLRMWSTNLEMYYDETSKVTADGTYQGSYPIGSSFSEMKSSLAKANINTSSIKDPEGITYIYKYCSSNGEKFNLAVVLRDSPVDYKINSADGADTCTPGE